MLPLWPQREGPTGSELSRSDDEDADGRDCFLSHSLIALITADYLLHLLLQKLLGGGFAQEAEVRLGVRWADIASCFSNS